MSIFAHALTFLPGMQWLSLPDEVDVFGKMMNEQLNLRIEADNLIEFESKFQGRNLPVTFPRPLKVWSTRDVLVEEFENAVPLETFMKNGGGPCNSILAEIGLDAFLNMLLLDNFVHSDLHPGNIMVKFCKPITTGTLLKNVWSSLCAKYITGDSAAGTTQTTHADADSDSLVDGLRHLRHDPVAWRQELRSICEQGYLPEIVFIDAGLVTTLDAVDRKNFLDLFRAVAEFDGYRAGHLMVSRCRTPELAINTETFALKMQHIVLNVKRKTFSLGQIKISDILTEVLTAVRQHHVRMEADFVNTVISILLLEGIGRQLDPKLDLFKSALPILRQLGRQMSTQENMKELPSGNMGAFLKLWVWMEARELASSALVNVDELVRRDWYVFLQRCETVDFQTVCIVTPETVDVSSIKLLRKSFDLVVGVEVIEQEDIKGLQLLVPDVGWPDIFNSGVMVFSPGEDKFKHLVELLKTKGSWDGGDQGLLNEWRGDNWNRLSFTYNTTPTAAYTYAPAYERFGARISAIHFIGPNKPWKSLPWREPGQKSVDQPQLGPQQTYDYSALLDRWFQVYDRHYRIDTPVSRSDFEVQRYSSAWDAVSSAGDNSSISATTPLQGVFGLADLRRIATEGYSSSGNKSYPVAMPVEGQYRSMPLDGRVDLMRPRKQPEPEAEVSQDGPGEQTPTARDTAGFDQGQHELPEGVQQMRMYTLPTPGPNEVPPTPYGHYQSLPSSETPTPYYGPASVGYRDDHDHQRGHSHHHHFEQAQFTLHLPQVQDSDQYSSEPSAPVRGWHSPQTPHRSHHAGGHQQHTSPQTVSPTHSPTRSRRGGVPDGQPTSSPQSTHSTQHTGPHGHTDRGARHSPSHSRNPSFQHGAQPAHQERHGEPTLNVSQQRQQQHSPIQDHQFPPYLQSPRPQPPSPHWSSPQSQQHWSSSPQQHSSQQYVPQQQQHTPQHNPQQHSSPNHVIPHDQMPRSPSPPKVTWNPAVEPPPHDPPTQSAFPVDTYFPNIWDQAPSQIHDATYQSFPSDPTTPQPKSPAVFFDPPPPSTIPEQLLREGRYSNVLGHPTQEQSPGIPSAGPTPDRNKVKSVFPWEDKPRHVPRRVFPSSDLPPADKFVEEVKVSPVSPRNPTHGRTNSQPHTHSPPGGFPPQLSFSNAWDNVPSIQKFASKLLHPRQPSLTLPPTPDNSWRKRERREWQERQDASSMDGDDEDEGESDASVESDGNDKKGKQRSRASSSASAPAPSRGKKEYRMRGVQTVSPEMMNKGVQVTILREDGTIRLNSSSKRSVSVDRARAGRRNSYSECQRTVIHAFPVVGISDRVDFSSNPRITSHVLPAEDPFSSAAPGSVSRGSNVAEDGH
ncbi:hypothetical protein EUX98_g1061 [Antrodiella citrinella]|uniref:ABC1 atypical kinase-like domain-containing protein n=1 Tax=Antrodiella citrinella TaxID=2447956 RepID=A0A4S4N2H9_9APHY|nr:hypothetical protein EUX98_g1061 [Antrodiella citrinella]